MGELSTDEGQRELLSRLETVASSDISSVDAEIFTYPGSQEAIGLKEGMFVLNVIHETTRTLENLVDRLQVIANQGGRPVAQYRVGAWVVRGDFDNAVYGMAVIARKPGGPRRGPGSYTVEIRVPRS